MDESNMYNHFIKAKKPLNVSDEHWMLNLEMLSNDFIDIVGFTYDPKINFGTPRDEPILMYGGNPH